MSNIDREENLEMVQREAERAKVCEVQERIRTEIHPQSLDAQTMLRIIVLVSAEAEKDRNAFKNFLHYDIVFPFAKEAVLAKTSLSDWERAQLGSMMGNWYRLLSKEDCNEMLAVCLRYIDEHNEGDFEKLIEKVVPFFNALHEQSDEAMRAGLQLEKLTPEKPLLLDAFANVAARFESRFDGWRQLHKHSGKSYRELIENSLDTSDHDDGEY